MERKFVFSFSLLKDLPDFFSLDIESSCCIPLKFFFEMWVIPQKSRGVSLSVAKMTYWDLLPPLPLMITTLQCSHSAHNLAKSLPSSVSLLYAPPMPDSQKASADVTSTQGVLWLACNARANGHLKNRRAVFLTPVHTAHSAKASRNILF